MKIICGDCKKQVLTTIMEHLQECHPERYEYMQKVERERRREKAHSKTKQAQIQTVR